MKLKLPLHWGPDKQALRLEYCCGKKWSPMQLEFCSVDGHDRGTYQGRNT